MKLLIIGPTPPPHHGVSLSFEALLDQKARLGFEVCHLELADRRGIEFVQRVDFGDAVLYLKQLLSLIGILLRHRPSVSYLAISQTALGFFRDSLFILLCALFRSKVIIHLHGGNFDRWYGGRGPFLRFYVRRVLALVKRAIVLDNKFKTLFDGLLPRDQIRVVPNGIAVPQGLARVGERDVSAPATVLYLGNLNRRKGALFLLEASSIVAAQRDDVKFVFAGPWTHREDEAAAEALLQRADPKPEVRFLGLVDGKAKWDLLANATLFVFPGQQQEGQPLSVLEAMACGLPTLFTDRGSLRETVVDGECGLEIDGEDPQDLARKILRMLDNPEEARRMGAAARARAEAHYSLNGFVEGMAQVFQDVAREN